MKKFNVSNNTTTVVKINEGALDETLAPMVYTIGQDMFGGFFLTHTKSRFTLSKLYGNTVTRAERILSTYKNRSKSTGVLLTGTKGSGKTLLAMHTANKAIDMGLPVILVNSPIVVMVSTLLWMT